MMKTQKRPSPRSIHLLKNLARLSVFCATGNKPGLRALLRSVAFKGVSPKKVEEVMLEVHLFAGFPATIDALIELRKFRLPGKSSIRIRLSETSQSRSRRGRRLCKRVYDQNFDQLMNRMQTLHPELARWIIEDGYGKVLSRGGLSLIEREIVAIAALAVLGWERQLRSHILGAVNIGANLADIRAIAATIQPHISKRRLRMVMPMLNCGEMA